MDVDRQRLAVTGLSREGNGVALLPGGRQLELMGSVPGDEVLVPLAALQKSQRVVSQYQVARPSSARVTPPCVVANACGGCRLMALAPHEQRIWKRNTVLRRLQNAGVSVAPELPRWSQLHTYLGYRNRVRLRVDEAGQVRPFNDEKLLECAVLEPSVRAASSELRDAAQRDPGLLSGMAHVEVRERDLDGNVGLWAVPRSTRAPQSGAELQATLLRGAPGASWARSVVGVAGVDDSPWQRYPIAPDLFAYVPVSSFRQVHSAVNADLVAEVKRLARRWGARRFVDLFCGTGNFALALADAGLVGVGVDLDATAMAAARASATEQHLGTVTFRAADVRRGLAMPEGAAPDLVIIDAPRAGMGEHAARVVADAMPEHIAVCSCEPTALARDVAGLVHSGYVLTDLAVFEMFPHTHHVETLAWLSRSNGRNASASAPSGV